MLAGYSNGDAISNEARTLQSVFQSWGYEAPIVCEDKRILPELRDSAWSVEQYRKSEDMDDIILLHLSIGSDINDLFALLPHKKKALLYHNITPAHFLRNVHRGLAHDLAWGREQLVKLAGVPLVSMADSSYNAQELHDAGYGATNVLPLVLNFDHLSGPFDAETYAQYKDGWVNILFVGRCVPNKKIEDALFAFHYYNQVINPCSRFIHVGSSAGTERYQAWLITQIRRLQIRNTHLVGTLPQAQLNAVYKAADVFLCMSEHEGFCIPLIEAMLHHVPVLAFGAGAIPETMDGCGVVIQEKNLGAVAEMTHTLVSDTALRSSIIDKQNARVAAYQNQNPAALIKTFLAPLL